jgi:hypothetical protein
LLSISISKEKAQLADFHKIDKFYFKRRWVIIFEMERSAGFSFKNMRYGLMAIILALAFGSFSVIETPDNPAPTQTVKKLGEVASIAINTPPTQT